MSLTQKLGKLAVFVQALVSRSYFTPKRKNRKAKKKTLATLCLCVRIMEPVSKILQLGLTLTIPEKEINYYSKLNMFEIAWIGIDSL